MQKKNVLSHSLVAVGSHLFHNISIGIKHKRMKKKKKLVEKTLLVARSVNLLITQVDIVNQSQKSWSWIWLHFFNIFFLLNRSKIYVVETACPIQRGICEDCEYFCKNRLWWDWVLLTHQASWFVKKLIYYL